MLTRIKAEAALRGAENRFPGNGYSEATRAAIMRAHVKLDDSVFERIVDRVCSRTRRLPTLADFLSESGPLLKHLAERERAEKLKKLDELPDKCRMCGNLGWIFAAHRETRYEYAFRCASCNLAWRRSLAPSIPQWDEDKHAAIFDARPINERPPGWPQDPTHSRVAPKARANLRAGLGSRAPGEGPRQERLAGLLAGDQNAQ